MIEPGKREKLQFAKNGKECDWGIERFDTSTEDGSTRGRGNRQKPIWSFTLCPFRKTDRSTNRSVRVDTADGMMTRALMVMMNGAILMLRRRILSHQCHILNHSSNTS